MNRIRFLSRRPAALLLAASLAILAVQPAAADESAVVTGSANIVPGTLTADQWSLSENCRATPASTAYTFSWVVAVTDATGSGAGWTLTLTPMYFGTRRPSTGTYIGSVQALDDSSWEGSSPADEIIRQRVHHRGAGGPGHRPGQWPVGAGRHPRFERVRYGRRPDVRLFRGRWAVA